MDGGDGHDNLLLNIDGSSTAFQIDLYGGDGDDLIEVSGTGDDLIVSHTNVEGGIGDDIIDVALRQWGGAGTYNSTPSTIDALGGKGADLISAEIYAVTTGATLSLQGGEGNDTIAGNSSAVGDGGGSSENFAWGNAGDDTIDLAANTYLDGSKNFAYGGGGDDTVRGVSDGLNELHGGNGADQINGLISLRSSPRTGTTSTTGETCFMAKVGTTDLQPPSASQVSP